MALYTPGIQISTDWQWNQDNPSSFTANAVGGQEYDSVKDLVNAVNKWLEDNNICFMWHGEMSRFERNAVIYRYQVLLTSEADLMLFNLRWAI